ncbi:unnamed protein product, partial [Discosporangium mesarthrocarpum]
KATEADARDLDLPLPWTEGEAVKFSAVMIGGEKEFSAKVKAELPGREVAEVVDRYYGGWKKTENYLAMKKAIHAAKMSMICWRCYEEGDLLCCDGEGCDALYHMKCVYIKYLPQGDWFCPRCVAKRTK